MFGAGRGWGGRHCDASHPSQPASQPASVAAFGAGGGIEPGMAELAARTGWIFTAASTWARQEDQGLEGWDGLVLSMGKRLPELGF